MKKLFSLLFLAVIATVTAQSTGQLSYNLDFSSDDPNMAMAIPMMQGSTMDLFFIPEKSKVNMSMGSFVKMETVIDVKADKGLMLMEMMGNKTATEMKLSEIDKSKDQSAAPKVETTSETKTIIGYKCTKTIVHDADGNEMIMWVAPDLKAALKGTQQFGNYAVNGIPLEFSTKAKGMMIHFVATKFDKNVDAKIFSLKIPEGYKVTTEEELKKIGMGR